MYIVRSRCGEPDEQQHRSVVRTTQRWVSRPCSTPDSKVAQCGQSTQESVEVAIDEWLYDFGPLAFVQRLVFEQGRLVAVVSSERGRKQRGAALKADAPAAGSATRADGLSPSAKPARPWWAR
jgi:hypothetical protein